MKPEDQAVFDALYRSHSSFFEERGILVSFADYMAGFEAACAHRDAQPSVAVNQRMRTALQEIANTVNYAQWYQETAEKALEDANHTEVALDKVAAVAVDDQFAVLIKKANDQAEHFEREWYLRGDELEALEQVNAQLLEALKELMYARTDKAEGMADAAIARAALLQAREAGL